MPDGQHSHSQGFIDPNPPLFLDPTSAATKGRARTRHCNQNMPTTQERKRFRRRTWNVTKPVSHVYLFSFSKEWDDNRSSVSISTCQSTARYLSYNYYPQDARSSTVSGVALRIPPFPYASGAHGHPRRQNMSSSNLCHVPDAPVHPQGFSSTIQHMPAHMIKKTRPHRHPVYQWCRLGGRIYFRNAIRSTPRFASSHLV